jgi:hypothetical protein
MRDEDKTKDRLIAELVGLHKRVAELEESEAQRKQLEVSRALKIGEILMEIGCLTRLQLVRYLERQKEDMDGYRYKHRQKRLGEILIEAGIITEEQPHDALAKHQVRLRDWLRSPAEQRKRFQYQGS